MTLFHQGGSRNKGRETGDRDSAPNRPRKGFTLQSYRGCGAKRGKVQQGTESQLRQAKEMRHYSYEEALIALSTYPGGQTSSWKPTWVQVMFRRIWDDVRGCSEEKCVQHPCVWPEHVCRYVYMLAHVCVHVRNMFCTCV